MKTNEELEEALEELKKEFYFFTKNGSSGGNSGGNTGTSKPTPSPDDDGWTVLYDKDSEDPNVNLGQTTGIHSNLGLMNSFPDLANYSKIRFVFHVTNCLCNYDFNITKFGYNEFHYLVHNGVPNDFVTCNNYIQPDSDGKLVLGIGPIYRLYVYTTGSTRNPARTHCINEADTCYYQILVK